MTSRFIYIKNVSWLRTCFPCVIWSLGCILIELATGKIAFDSNDLVYSLFLIQNLIEPLPDWICKQCNDEQIYSMIYQNLNLIKPKKWMEWLFWYGEIIWYSEIWWKIGRFGIENVENGQILFKELKMMKW